MNNNGTLRLARIRPLIFAAVAVLHIALILFAGFRTELPARSAEPAAGVMRLVDVREEAPQPSPPSPPPPPASTPALPAPAAIEALAETVIESDEAPSAITEAEAAPFSAPDAAPAATIAPAQSHALFGQHEYLPRHMVSTLPLLPEAEIARAIVYPRTARRLNIEGMVTLELFIDRQGAITEVRLIRESPPNRGFGEAALHAFRGIRALSPAKVNDEPVAVRFQYNLRFTLR